MTQFKKCDRDTLFLGKGDKMLTEFFNAIGNGLAETLHGEYGLESLGITAIVAIILGRRYIDYQSGGNTGISRQTAETPAGTTPVIEDSSTS